MTKTATTSKDRNPNYRLHKASGQAIVTLSGEDHYLGRYGTRASRKKYGELIAKWWANECRPIKPPKAEADDDVGSLTVAELVLQFLDWATSHYVKNGKQTQEPACLHYAAKPMVEKFGSWIRPCGGTVVTPTMKAMIDVMTMLRISAAGTFRT